MSHTTAGLNLLIADKSDPERDALANVFAKHAVLLHAEARLRFNQFLATGDRARSVVITHHAPSIKSVPATKTNDLISAAYASNLDDLILHQGPKLWIHGHIHETRDYLIGGTHVLNNSLGYQIAINPENRFRSRLGRGCLTSKLDGRR